MRASSIQQVAILALWAALTAQPSAAIIVRHDRPDADYIELGASYTTVIVHMNTHEPGGPPDGFGTLISPLWVATAAHIAEIIKPGHRLTVASSEAEAEEILLHPDWDGGAHDIALVRLTQPATEGRPVSLYRGRDEVGQLIVVAGSGDTGTGISGPTGNDGKLRAARNLIDEASERWLKFRFDPPDSALEMEGISGPGDSGGPALLRSEDALYLVGVGSGQSTRATDGREGLYGVVEYYTRVSSYLPWIDGVISEPEGDPLGVDTEPR